MKSKKICFFSDDYLPAKTGVGVSISLMAEDLVRRGHKVLVLTTRRPGQPKKELVRGVSIYRLPSVLLFGFYQALAAPRQIRRILAAHRIEIAHFHYLGLLSLFGSWAAGQLGIFRVFTHHMTVDHLTQPRLMKPFKPLLARMIDRFCSQMDLATAPSDNFVDRNRDQSPVRLVFLSNPLPFDIKSPPRNIDIPPKDGFEILFVGRLDEEKNVPFLIRATAMALKTRAGIRLKIAGTGREEPRLRRLVRSLGIQNQVEFLGWVARDLLPAFYRRSDVFVLPSRVEAQAIVALEAMMFCKPVIMAETIVSATELIEEGENGFIVKGDDDQGLARALGYLADHPERAREMGIRGRQRILSADVSLDEVVAKLETIYESLWRSASVVPTGV